MMMRTCKKQNKEQSKWLVMALMMVFLFPAQAMAQVPPAEEQCTTSATFQNDQNTYLLSEISNFIEVNVMNASQALFNGIVIGSGFSEVAAAAMTLFVLIFAFMFLFGLVPMTLGQALIRGVKIAIVAALVSPAGWGYLSTTVIRFFNDGTKEIVGKVVEVGLNSDVIGGQSIMSDHTFSGACAGYFPGSTTASPFCPVDVVFGGFLSPETLVHFAGTMATGPFGAAMGVMMIFGAGAFIMMLIEALKIYAISIIAKALLFGLAPFFFLAMLFERTKQIFSSWVNQLVNYSLQPILLFIFFSFYLVLLDYAIKDMLGSELCWADVNVTEGNPDPTKWWRFCSGEGETRTCSTDWTWEGSVDCLRGGGGNCADFPFSPVNGLMFLLLSVLAYKFNKVVQVIATELSASTVMLNKAGRDFFDR